MKNLLMSAHPFLFTLNSLLFFYMRAKSEAVPTEIFRPLLVLLVLLVVLHPIARKIGGSQDWAGILLTIFVFGFYFDRNYFVIVGALVAASLIVLYAYLLLMKRDVRISTFSATLTVLGLALLVVQSMILFNWFRPIPRVYYQAMAARGESISVPIVEPTSGVKPDIYYIVLDSYAGSDVLRDFYDYDNSGFVDDLKELGFIVPDAVLSNYPRTALSITSTLDMQYWDTIAPKMEHVPYWWPTKPVFDHSRARASLESIGYRSISIGSDWELANNRTADEYLKPFPVMLTEYEDLMIRSTALTLLHRPFQAVAPVRTNESHRLMFSFAMQTLSAIPDLPGPKFIFVHILPPHSPFVFNADGTPLDTGEKFWFGHPQGLTTEQYRQYYLAQIEYVDSQIRSVVETILAKSETPPIILIQADHGLGLSVSFNAENDCLRERFSTFAAYYLPGKQPDELPEVLTPVNLFRIVFNEYFDANLELLENRHYYTKGHSLFAGLRDVTQQVHDACEFPPIDE